MSTHDPGPDPSPTDREIQAQWELALGNMLRDYRSKHPDDARGDRELLESMMEHFCATGLIHKNEAGKYVLPRIV